MTRTSNLCAIAIAAIAVSACGTMQMGAPGAKTVATGSTGGASAVNANSKLERCDRSLGTISITEDTTEQWWSHMAHTYKINSTVPLLRLIVQQSNCFVIVERGRAMSKMTQERELSKSGDLRDNSNFGKGQMVSADYTVTPSITFSEGDTSGLRGIAAGMLGPVGALVAGGMKSREASTMLILMDNRSGIQLAAAEGSAKNWDFGMLGGLFSNGVLGAGGHTNTPEKKVLAAAFMDSYNQMVQAVRTYKAQDVEGGLGKGGKLKTN